MAHATARQRAAPRTETCVSARAHSAAAYYVTQSAVVDLAHLPTNGTANVCGHCTLLAWHHTAPQHRTVPAALATGLPHSVDAPTPAGHLKAKALLCRRRRARQRPVQVMAWAPEAEIRQQQAHAHINAHPKGVYTHHTTSTPRLTGATVVGAAVAGAASTATLKLSARRVPSST